MNRIIAISFTITALGFICIVVAYLLFKTSVFRDNEFSIPIKTVDDKPFERYSIESLRGVNNISSDLNIVEIIEENLDFVSHKFNLTFDPTLEEGKRKTVSGQINFPVETQVAPIIIMIRGYVDQSIYQTGIGTSRVASVFASNGFITIAPDFLGYAESDTNSEDIFESRFQTYTTILALIDSLNKLQSIESGGAKWDGRNIFIWGHSNGGQIALTTLVITQENYPTSLWAPVAIYFPYSVLYYTNESGDRGKFIRRELSKFENSYDTDKFTFDNYLASILAPIQIQQGLNDSAVPPTWNRNLTKLLDTKEKDVTYVEYPQADHNLRPNWEEAVNKDLEFFRKHIKLD